MVYTIYQYTPPGLATISPVYLIDSANNSTPLSSSDLINLGFDADFQIMNSTADIAAPSIIAFDISPQIVDVTNGPVDVTVTMTATDNLSGIYLVSTNMNLPN